MFKGFRDFLMRGNVVELAIAVVIGSAFAALVTTVTRSLIQPLINVFLGGGVNGGTFVVRGQRFDVGAVINGFVTFVITAAVVYALVVVPLKAVEERRRRGEAVPAAPPSDETVLLAEIRDLLARQGRD